MKRLIPRLPVLALIVASMAALGAVAEPPGRARLKGRIAERDLAIAGQCRMAEKGEPFAFWSDGVEMPAGADTNRDGVYLALRVSRRSDDARPAASISFAASGQAVMHRLALPQFTLNGNTLSVDTRVESPGEQPRIVRLVIVCDRR